MDRWEFLQERHGGSWYWRHTNAAGAVRSSTASFDSESDCIGNAIYHGYQPYRSHALQDHSALPA